MIMYRKRFYVRIDLQLHAITCPGVWLCKHGHLEVTIKAFGYIFRTGAMEPRFPLLAHDQFTIEGFFKSVGNMEELEKVLAAEKVEITLWQCGRRLAYFVGKLADVMQSGMLPKLTCEHNVNVQLLMKATPAFPGIIAPKVELTANVGIGDRLSRRSSSATSQRSTNYRGDFVTPNFQTKPIPRVNRHVKLDSAGKTRKLPDCCDYLEEPRRQQTVRHVKHYGCGSPNECSTPQYVPSSYFGSSGLFEADSVKHKNNSRRFSSSSNQSFAISQGSSSFSSEYSSMGSNHCTHTWVSGDNLQPINEDNHQDRCEICQSYRKAFLMAGKF